MKICGRCKKSLPLSEFHKAPERHDGLKWDCKKCRNATLRKWRSKNPERSAEQLRKGAYKFNYSITTEDYDRMLKEQEGKCAICKDSEPGPPDHQRFHIDHNHSTDEVRKLLCGWCNIGIGFFDEDPELLIAAAEYLRSFQ